ncbi:MAG TPA: S8 family serine peptidase [Symbiobacteriaceae bacterium]|nr:S8 family serine peptidase [Symbiobacteriaceae bacterium]
MRRLWTQTWWGRLIVLPLLSLSLATPGLAAPQAKSSPTVRAIEPGRSVAKVDAKLQSDLAKGGKKTFLVRFKAQADLQGAATAATATAKASGKTPKGEREERAKAVYQSLKGTADLTQRNLKPALDALKQKGNITSYESFYIVNAIAVTGDAKALAQLAAHPAVESITPSRTFKVIDGKNFAAAKGAPKGAVTPPKTGTNLPTAPKVGTNTPAQPSVGTNATAPAGGAIQSIEWGVQAIGAPAVWAEGIDGTGVVVASLDTGVDGEHPALARKWRGADGSDPIFSWFDAVNDQNDFPYDDHGHGTHTTGTMVGSEESGENQIGVAPGAQWIAAKILSGSGSGTDVDIIEAGEWILAPGDDPTMAPDIVSNSWGGGPGLDEWFRPIVQAWRAAGIVPVFANGNDGPGAGTVSAPGNYPEAIGVGATDINSNLAGFSGRGPSPYGEVKPEISAPGVNVRSAVPGGGYEGGWSGTSMATPHITGVAALLRQANASLTPDQIEEILIQTAVPRTDGTYRDVPNNGYGHGIVSAYDAVAAVTTGLGTMSGRVLVGGDDLDEPTITHTPVTQLYMGFPARVQAIVADNVGITEVNLYVRRQGSTYFTMVPMTQTAGDHMNGTFEATFPSELMAPPAVEYYIRAVDFGNNPVQTSLYTVAVSSGLQPGWSTDLETEPAGWYHDGTNDPWEWGAPTSGPGSAHSGSKLWATKLGGNYPDGTNAMLALPPLDLTTSTHATIEFWHWYDFETGWDSGDLWVIDQANEAHPIDSFTGSSDGWHKVTVDLSEYAGQRVIFLFNMVSDGSVNMPGWYIDDISLPMPDTTAPAAPTGLTGSSDPLGAVNLVWNANTDADLTNYRVYRSTAGAAYAALGYAENNAYTDGSAPSGQESIYAVTAIDRWGNESAQSNTFSITPSGPNVIFFDDFETADDHGWTHSGASDPWQHGTPTSGPGSAFAGAKVWATNLAGNYANNTNASLVSPPINLAGTSNVALQFAHWYDIETGWDFGYVEVSSNGGSSWTQVAPPVSGRNSAWEQPVIDLSRYAGQTIQVRFRLTSDSSVTKAGWYIDDVKVISAVGASRWKQHVDLKAKKATKVDPTPQFNRLTKPTAPTGVKGGTVSGGAGIMALPADATITIRETGRSTRTSPATGSYTMRHAAGTFTAVVEAYGYFPLERSVTITPDGTTRQNFFLTPIPKGVVEGTVTDARSGAPVAGAMVRQVEDSRVAPVTTDASGHYSLEVLQGSYTLQISAAHYYPFSTSVTVPGNGSATVDAQLEPFIGFEGEIKYDDGSAENAQAFYESGNGFAMRMSPDPTKGTAMLAGASFFTWDESWPNPGGTNFAVSVWDASGPDGSPGHQVAGPIQVTATRGDWTTVDLASLGLSFTGDFYLVYVQVGDYPNVPGLGIDESNDVRRGWVYVGGSWSQLPNGFGNFMIRASVLYAVGIPTITSPTNGLVTNQVDQLVEGTSTDGANVRLFLDGTFVGDDEVEGGRFSIPVTLHDGENALTVTAQVETGETRPSAPVMVTVDLVAPTLTVTSPTDGTTTNRETVVVAGRATDLHLSQVRVNGQPVTLAGDGSFSHQIILAEGANLIAVEAADSAGNVTRIDRHLTRDSAGPTLANIQPATDVTIATGESVTIAFDAEPGMTQVGYRIVLSAPATTGGSALTDPVNMHEVSAGHYAGTWTAPANTQFSGAAIQVWAIDAAGNRADGAAAGRLTVTVPNSAPTARIILPNNPRKNRDLTFDGSRSTDADGRIVRFAWSWGDTTASTEGAIVTHRYTRSGTYTVTLTVTDDRGATATDSKVVVIP